MARPYAQLLAGGHRYADWSDAPARLQRALQRRTGWSDTHPALGDRLASLGAAAAVPPAAEQSAAAAFLGPTAEVLAREFDERWRAGISQPWRERHEQRQQERQELAMLDEQAAGAGALDRAALWRQALLTEIVHDPATALPRFQAFAEAYPDSAEARYAIGQILLGQGDDAGIALIDAVMRQDPNAIKPGAVLVHQYLTDRGREAEARPYLDAWQARDDLEQQAAAERAEFRPKDDYLDHGLDAGEVDRLRIQAATLPWLGQLWLVRKRVAVFPEQPAWLLLVKPRWYKRIKPALAETEIRRTLDLADTLTVAVHRSELKALFRRATRMAVGSLIYRA